MHMHRQASGDPLPAARSSSQSVKSSGSTFRVVGWLAVFRPLRRVSDFSLAPPWAAMGFATEQQALESDPAFESVHERLASDQARLGDRQRALGRVKLKKRRLPASRRGNFLQKLDCLRPWQQAKSPFYNDELLTQPLERGRVCAVHTCQMGPRGFCLLVGSATCSQFSCGLNVRDDVATAAEALAMVEHGRRVLKQVAHAAGRRVEAYERLEFLDGARHGSEEGHLLGILLAERLRRLTSAQFGVPLPRLQLSEHFLAMHSACHPLPCSGLPSTVHCDEVRAR